MEMLMITSKIKARQRLLDNDHRLTHYFQDETLLHLIVVFIRQQIPA